MISGGDWPQFEKQLLSNLPSDNRLANLPILPTCGTKFFRYTGSWQKIYSEDFSKEERARIIESLENAVASTGFMPEKVWGEQIEDRGSQITFSAWASEHPSKRRRSGIRILPKEIRSSLFLIR